MLVPDVFIINVTKLPFYLSKIFYKTASYTSTIHIFWVHVKPRLIITYPSMLTNTVTAILILQYLIIWEHVDTTYNHTTTRHDNNVSKNLTLFTLNLMPAIMTVWVDIALHDIKSCNPISTCITSTNTFTGTWRESMTSVFLLTRSSTL